MSSALAPSATPSPTSSSLVPPYCNPAPATSSSFPGSTSISKPSITKSAEIAAKARGLETDLIEEILASHDDQGVVGRNARKKLKLLPSTMYWAGLQAWGLRQFPGSQNDYHRWLDRYYKAANGLVRTEDGERVADGFRPAWRPGIPKAPEGFPRAPLPLRLTGDEARYLQERVLTSCAGSLLAHLVDRCQPAEDAEFVWLHPEYGSFSERHQAQLVHARNLSELVFGAVLAYNLMLAEKFARREDWIEDYREQYQDWCNDVAERRDAYEAWNRDAFWATVLKVNPRITATTRAFIDTWFNLALGPNREGYPGPVRSAASFRTASSVSRASLHACTTSWP